MLYARAIRVHIITLKVGLESNMMLQNLDNINLQVSCVHVF